jgi:hypothetical protein
LDAAARCVYTVDGIVGKLSTARKAVGKGTQAMKSDEIEVIESGGDVFEVHRFEGDGGAVIVVERKLGACRFGICVFELGETGGIKAREVAKGMIEPDAPPLANGSSFSGTVTGTGAISRMLQPYIAAAVDRWARMQARLTEEEAS